MSKTGDGLPQLIPREILFGNPVKTLPQISPDGLRLAYLAPVNNVLNIWMGEITTEDFSPVTHDQDRGIRVFFWGEDDRHLFYLQDVGGNENWRLYAVDLQGGGVRDLTPFDNVQVRIVSRNKYFPNELLLGINREDPKTHDVYHLDIGSGALTLRVKNPGNVVDWITDAHFVIRGALAATPDGGFELWTRADDQDPWKTLFKWDPDDSLTSEPVGFSKDGKFLYLKDSRKTNTGQLIRLDLASGAEEVIAEDDHYEVGDVVMHPDSHEIQMVSFERARNEWLVLDEGIQEDVDALQQLHPGDFSLMGRDRAEQNWVVAYNRDDGPIGFYLYRRQSRQASFLFDTKPDLKNYTLSSMEPIRFTARDGLVIEGYISFPPGLEKENLPLVLNVHGGPWARDSWGYDPEAQWFANRGYICLQVNFRGSTGYGKSFINASIKEWGGKMHDDLVDAVAWAVERGYADSERIAIYGGSYGGYAALVGATFTPDLFCCAVDIVGPSNLITMIQSIPPYWIPLQAMEHKRVGNPETEAEFLMSRSPLSKVDQIKIPVLIAHGANDPRVKQAESEQIVQAMKEKGLDYEYLLFADEGHGFAKPENRIKFYATAERFLAKHLHGRHEPVQG